MAVPDSLAQDDVKLDMTPMIDVVFLLIVFFLCIDFRVLEAKLPAYLPRDVGITNSVVPPVETLSLRVHVVETGVPVPMGGTSRRIVLQGHRVQWEIGARRFDDLAAGKRELERIAALPESFVLDPETGVRRRMACVVEGYTGSRYDDVAKAADACRAAGFERIDLGGGRGALPR